MNILDIDIQGSIPDIVDAYTKVYGTEYRDVIEKRINRIIFVMYNNSDGINSYCSFLKGCKRKELSIKFLEKIGIDVSKYKEKSYAEPLDDDVLDLIEEYIGGPIGIIPELKTFPEGIKAWRALEEDIDVEKVEEKKIKFVNFLRGQNSIPITKETFPAFCETYEHKQLLEKINEYLQVFDEIAKEYEEYLQEIAPYQNYVDDENKRSADMQTKRINTLYEQIEGILPDDLKAFLDEKYSNTEEKGKAVFGTVLGVKSYAEYFSQEDEEKLSDSSISESEKSWIYYYRVRYFQQMGIDLEKNVWDFKTKKESYDYYIHKESIKKLILPAKLASQITAQRTKEYEEFQREFIYSSQDFIENAKMFADNPSNKEWIYAIIRNKRVCITSGSDNQGFMPILFYTVRSTDGGKLDYIILHEICHSIEAKDYLSGKGYRSGFEFIDNSGNICNPYNSKCRKYERINETITDILAIESRQVLHEQGIYIIEPKELIDKDVNDSNTSSIVKKMLTTFFDKYREPIVRARILGDMKELYDIIGEENFEELNDVVNKVDSLEGLLHKLKNNQDEDPVAVEYYKQLERLKQIYANMEMHQSKKLLKNGEDR